MNTLDKSLPNNAVEHINTLRTDIGAIIKEIEG